MVSDCFLTQEKAFQLCMDWLPCHKLSDNNPPKNATDCNLAVKKVLTGPQPPPFFVPLTCCFYPVKGLNVLAELSALFRKKCGKIACRWIKQRKTSIMCWLVNNEDSVVSLAELRFVPVLPIWSLLACFGCFHLWKDCRSDAALQSKAILVCNSHSKWIMIEFSTVVVVMGRTGTGDVRENDCGSCS